MRVVGYARVSLEEQAYAQALKQQVWRLQDGGAETVYADTASRTKDDRAALMEILKLAEAGEIEQVLITRLDRITCSAGLLERITEVFKKAGVQLKAIDETVDLHSVDGEFSAGLQVMFAKREVRTIQLRSVRGHEYRRQQKRAGGMAPWGYLVQNGHYQLDHSPFLCLLDDHPLDGAEFVGRSKADLGRDIIQLFFNCGSLNGTVRAIHQKFGIQQFKRAPSSKPSFYVFASDGTTTRYEYINKRAGLFRWDASSLRGWINNPVLRGHTAYGVVQQVGGRRRKADPYEWQVIYDTHPDQQLLTEEEWQQIERMLQQNRADGGWGWNPKANREYPCSGLLYCGLCGSKMKVQSVKPGRIYYQCKAYGQAACTAQKMILGSTAQAAIISALTQRATQIAESAETVPAVQECADLTQLRQQLAGLKALGHNPAFETAKQQLEAQIKAHEHQQRQQVQTEVGLRELLIDRCSDPNYWMRLELKEQRSLFRWLVDRVIVTPTATDPVIEVRLKI